MFRFCSFLLFLAATLQATSALEKKATPPSFSSEVDQKCSLLPSGRHCLKNCETNKGGYFSEIAFLYMQPKIDNIPYALKEPAYQTAFDNEVLYPAFKFKPGFKLVLGGYVPRLNWDMTARWTELYSHTQKYSSSNSYEYRPVFWTEDAFSAASPLTFQKANSRLKIYFDSLQIEMGKSVALSPFLNIRIHGGIEADFIKQLIKVGYSDGAARDLGGGSYNRIISSQNSFKNLTKGAGLCVGFNSRWQLNQSGFHLLADPTASFLLTYFSLHQYFNNTQYAFSAGDSSSSFNYYNLKNKEHIWVLRPNAEIALGLDYEHCFSQLYLAVKAAYEVRYFWELNLTRRHNLLANSFAQKGDLFLHGLNLALRLEF